MLNLNKNKIVELRIDDISSLINNCSVEDIIDVSINFI